MIGGNTTVTLQTKGVATVNSIGERVHTWTDAATLLIGWLDLMGGDSKRAPFDSKLQDSTHIFICDYVPLTGITPENSRLVASGDVYEVLLIDNPMGLNQHLEIYLKYTGGQ